MPSIPRVNSFLHALQVLDHLRSSGSASSGDLKRTIGATEGSIYRLITTLLDLGYIEKAPDTRAYKLAQRSRSLAYGYDDETWPDEVARPVLTALSQDIRWPAAFGTLEGPHVHVRATSDESSHFVLRQLKAGRRVPLFKSAIGWVSMAATAPKLRSRLKRSVEAASRVESIDIPDPAACDRTLSRIIKRGYHCVGDNKTRQIVLAVPVIAGAHVLGGISIRVYVAGSSETEVVRRYLKPVRRAAQAISQGYKKRSTS